MFEQVFTDQNVWAIIVLAFAYVIFGALWYSPKVFGSACTECGTMSEQECKAKQSSPMCYVLSFINALFAVFVLSLFVRWVGAQTFWEGGVVGFWAWLGFVATSYFSGVIWEKMSLKAFFVHILYALIAMFVLGGFLAIW